MKIIHCNTVADRGGAAKVAVNICRGLSLLNNDVTLVYARGKKPSGINSFKIETELESRLYAGRCRIFDDDGFSSYLPTKRLIEYIDEQHPDVFHLHNAHGYYLNINILFNYLKSKKIPSVWTIHDYWPVTGHCSFYTLGNCNKWEYGQCSNCPSKKKYPKSYFLDRSKTHYLQKKKIFEGGYNITTVTPSRWVLAQLTKSPIEFEKMICIPNGVDTSVFCPKDVSLRQQYNLEDSFIILGIANGWGSRKGYSDFLRLASLLPSEYKIVMVGFSEIPNDLPPQVIPIGRIDQEKIIEWYNTADVFVSLSKDETFGLTSIESLACGTPIIQYDATTSREIIVPSCGRICKDLDEVVTAIQEIISMGDLAENCRKRAEEFSVTRMCSNYLSLYKDIIK